ncbi:PQQ-dependent sugar dehydrogenase [Lacipirellula sp.]|uniref:PQQ-dependent sugar dehydrogenase n=1 Tax=Lacipirellula sp. TaxID=2691419 RepID=UPI003D0ABA57
MKFLPFLQPGCALRNQSAGKWLQAAPMVAALAGIGGLATETEAGIVGRKLVATGLNAPMFATFAPGDSTRLFIAERGAGSASNATAAIRILNLQTGLLEPTPFLSIPGVNTNTEGGLLGLAFHPDFQTNRKFYAYVTANDSDPNTPFSSYIREYTAPSATSNTANTAFTPILSWPQPQANHNGGFIGFSPNDGYLYVALGDGGNGNDQGTGHTEPGGNAQDLTSNFLGKMLRVDVDRDDFPADANKNYGIPYDTAESPGNPFAPATPGATNPTGDDEIWAYGLRNPYRAGFDRATGDLWIGDVGQDRREEIDFQPGNSQGGENYGWRIREGLIQTPSVGGPKPTGVIDPVWDYKRPGDSTLTPAEADFVGTTVIGGVPYRGPDPELQGLYFFGDYGSNRLWTLRPATETSPQVVTYVTPQLPVDTGSPGGLSSIVEDANGNIYLTYLSGSVYRIVTNALTPGDFNADAKVDGTDLAAWKTGFGTTTGATAANGDADGDGDVDGADFLAWQRNYGWSALNVGGAPAATVPEPTTAFLGGLAALGLVRGRRRV